MEGYDDYEDETSCGAYDHSGLWPTSEWEKSQYLNGALWQYGQHVRNQITHNLGMEDPSEVIRKSTEDLQKLQIELQELMRTHKPIHQEAPDDEDFEVLYERWFDPWGASQEDWDAHQAEERIRRMTFECGRSLNKLLRKYTSETSYRRVFSQIIVDMKIEYAEALQNGNSARATLVILAGFMSIARALASELLMALLGKLLRKAGRS